MIESITMALSLSLNEMGKRAIMPLPRRPLRDRLPPDVAATIEYPPSTAPSVFSYLPDTPPRDESSQKIFTGLGTLDGSIRPPNQGVAHSASQGGEILVNGRLEATNARLPTPQPSLSTASSTDGQDVLECNNKKKRKIPTASDAVLHSGLGEYSPPFSTNMASPVGSIHSGSVEYSGSGAYTSMGISGSGRGTLGRSRSRPARHPLRDLAGGNANWGGYRSSGSRLGHGQSPGDKNSLGIISSAIANAEKSPTKDSTFAMSTDFSFRCKSQIQGLGLLGPPEPVSRTSQSPAATSPGMTKAGQTQHPAPAPDPAEVERQNRRRLVREYTQASRSRKQRQQLDNIHNPPKPEDVWICEFCEYEALFKEPPRGLIRMYEMKDRKLRDQEAERRRLLEKAKIKRKKAKKPTKGAVQGTQQPTNNSSTPQQGTAPGGESSRRPDHHGDGWGGGGGNGGGNGGGGRHGHSGNHEEPESDAADIDSDEGPPDLFREYAHSLVPLDTPSSTVRVG